jgi:hypothetical protein
VTLKTQCLNGDKVVIDGGSPSWCRGLAAA